MTYDAGDPLPAEFRRLADKVRNWGRWGDGDQLGTLNLLTADHVRAAAALVKRGQVFSLGAEFGPDGPWAGHAWRRNTILTMRVDGGDAESLGTHLTRHADEVAQQTAATWRTGVTRFNEDMVVMPLQASTQWDALSHIYYEGQMYNGHPAAAVTSFGATLNAVDQVHEKGIIGRGVLLDLARHRGVDFLPRHASIPPEELDEIAKAQHVEIRPGDIVVTRTGWGWDHFRRLGNGSDWLGGTPGLSWRCAEWLYERQVAAVASDNCSVETAAQDLKGIWLPFHMLTIRDMGMMMGEIWQLEELAADCATDGVYEFQIVAPVLRVIGAVGSPVNPIAVK